ncbi:uncharacterized protein LOC128920075 [Zeugodacus cucurbitae]|uniref:uncharacterized protein LOC128920075 n=1 Tax=Zeugodacus cucurbitae TaxID=28588 RepID=UPI0023D8F8DD|nr:uncharacterized protein LOC128920075 [Zeugodacus cucurbitae]
MSTEQQSLFEAAFGDGLTDLILSSTSSRSVFKIDMARFEKGVFRLAINSVEDTSAIRSMVESLPELWDNCKLRMVRDDEVPEPLKTHIFVRGRAAVMSTECIVKMLAKQNTALRTELWEIFHRSSTPEGDVIVMGID